MPPLCHEPKVSVNYREPTGLTVYSQSFRRGDVRLTLYRDTTLKFLPESELVGEFVRHPSTIHSIAAFTIESVGSVTIRLNNQNIVFEVISSRTPIEHPVIEGILGLEAIESLSI